MSASLHTQTVLPCLIIQVLNIKSLLPKCLTLFPPKTNILVHSKNWGIKVDATVYVMMIPVNELHNILSRIIGASNTATKIRVPISDTGHMAQISTANPEILINFHVCSCKVYSCSCKIYLCSCKIHAFPCIFMCIHAKFICAHVKFYMNFQSTSIKVPAHQL